MLPLRLKGRWTPKTLLEHRVISSLFNVVIETHTHMDCLCAKDCQSTEWSLHCSMLSLRFKGRWTPSVQNTVRAQSDLFTVQCCHSDSKADGPPLCKTLPEHRVISSLFNVVIQTQREMDPPGNTEHRVISSLFNVVIQNQRQMDPPVKSVRAQSNLFTVQCCHSDSKADGPPCAKHCQSTEWSLHCSMLSLRLKGRWTPWSTLSEHRVISSLFNVVIQTQRQMDTPVNTVRAQSDLFTVQCCHWDSKADEPPWSTLSDHRVISSLFNVVIQTQRQMDPPKHCQSIEWSLHCSMLSLRLKGRGTPYVQNTVRAQSDLFTVQCCHSDSKADGPPPSQHCQSTEWSLHCSMLSFRLKGRWTPQSTLSEHRVISSLLNVVIQTDRLVDSPQNTVRAQSDLFTVQCCHSDSKADEPLGQHCPSTELSLHCSMLSFRFKGRWTPQSTLSENRVISSLFNVAIETQRQMDPPVNTVRAHSDLFTVQCCHSDSNADGPPMCKTLSEHRVISSLFNVVIQTQRQMDPPGQHCQSTEWSLHCSMLSLRLKDRWTSQSTLSEHRVISSLFNVVIQTQRQVDPPWSTLSEHRVISSLFNVVIQTHKADGPPLCKTLPEHRVISSLFNVVIETQRQMDPPGQHCQSTELSLHCSMLSFRLKCRWTPQSNTVRAQSDLFTVQCCYSDSKADGPLSTLSEHRVISSLFNVVIQTQRQMDPPLVNIVRAQSDLFTVQCCHSDSQADGPRLCKTLPEHRVISSLFNVVIETQRQMDPPGQHCQSTEWSLHCSMLSFRLKCRWTPQPTLSEHRVISSLLNVVIQTQRQMEPPVHIVRTQNDIFTVQCCHWDWKVGGPPKTLLEHRVISSLFNVVIQTQRQMDPPQSTLSEHRLISSLFNVAIETERQMDPPWTLSEHRLISSMFNVVIQAQRQMDPPGQHCQSTEWSLHCSMLSFRLKGRWTPQSTLVRAQSYLFTVQCCHSDSKADGPPSQHCQSTEWSLHCSMLSLRLKGRWTPLVNTVRAQSDLFTVQCCHSDSKADGPPWSTLSEHRVISSLFNVVIETQRQKEPPVNIVRAQSDLFTVQCCHSDSKAEGSP